MAGYRKLNRRSDQRKAMLRDLVTQLIIHERITTTETKAKELGKMRVEGKDYVMQDGDVVHFRFNV